jgi:3-methyladenine DNA glycosylase AlkD
MTQPKSVPAKTLTRLRTALRSVAVPSRAPKMQAYMKSTMPYLGVISPDLKKTCRDFFSDWPWHDFESWHSAVLHIWRNAKFREERYAALYLAGMKQSKSFHTIDAMPMFEEMIVSGAWWDFVDDIASHRVGLVLQNDSSATKKLMLKWSTSADIWKRRTSILCQLSAKEKTDLVFLYKCIEPSLSAPEFFLRKAIGWALREVAWRDPKEVIRYVTLNKNKLSGLSKREALKNVLKSGKIKAIP